MLSIEILGLIAMTVVRLAVTGLWLTALILSLRLKRPGAGHLAVAFGLFLLLRLVEGSLMGFLPLRLQQAGLPLARMGFLLTGAAVGFELVRVAVLVILVVGLARLFRKEEA